MHVVRNEIYLQGSRLKQVPLSPNSMVYNVLEFGTVFHPSALQVASNKFGGTLSNPYYLRLRQEMFIDRTQGIACENKTGNEHDGLNCEVY